MREGSFIYEYCGPVCIFGQCVQNGWTATTRAVSEKKARSNLAYMWKMQNNKMPNSRVELPGELKVVGGQLYE